MIILPQIGFQKLATMVASMIFKEASSCPDTPAERGVLMLQLIGVLIIQLKDTDWRIIASWLKYQDTSFSWSIRPLLSAGG